MVTAQKNLTEERIKIVSELWEAGIRFVYFSELEKLKFDAIFIISIEKNRVVITPPLLG